MTRRLADQPGNQIGDATSAPCECCGQPVHQVPGKIARQFCPDCRQLRRHLLGLARSIRGTRFAEKAFAGALRASVFALVVNQLPIRWHSERGVDGRFR